MAESRIGTRTGCGLHGVWSVKTLKNDRLSYRLDGITFPKWRKESIKAYGNAIVPQVAYRIFETINEYETLSRAKRSEK